MMSAVDLSQYTTGSRQAIAVDANDAEQGAVDFYEAHRYPLIRHRAISVWLFRRRQGQVEVLLQQRSQRKPVGQGLWVNTVCANVAPGESRIECALRRLREEIGLELPAEALTPLGIFEYKAYGNDQFGEHEIDQIFAGRIEPDAQLKLNPDEVQATAWVDWQDFLAKNQTALAAAPKPAETVQLVSLEEIRAKAGPVPVRFTDADGRQHQGDFAPWSAMMIGLEEVGEWLATSAI